jgi:hypothetical protein
MEEQWKSIINYPNYEISNLGNCRNIIAKIKGSSHNPYKNLKACINKSGYKQYDLVRYDENGIKITKKSLLVHRLIAIHFIPNIENKLQVDHINNNKLDNSISNLRWVTPSENSRNQKKRKNTTSQYVGVGFYNIENKWKYHVNINGKIYQKQFDTEHEAAVKRDEFILDNDLKYFKLNFIHI